jgi:hypothetical protein
MTKSTKTRDELQRIVMECVRTHPELSAIRSVVILNRPRSQPYQPNWDVGFGRASPFLADPEGIARTIVTDLQNKFDLEEDAGDRSAALVSNRTDDTTG